MLDRFSLARSRSGVPITSSDISDCIVATSALSNVAI